MTNPLHVLLWLLDLAIALMLLVFTAALVVGVARGIQTSRQRRRHTCGRVCSEGHTYRPPCRLSHL